MNNRIFIALVLSGSFAAGLIVGESKRAPGLPTAEIAKATDAAFRDGLYQARLDTKDGRKPHLAIGRWTSPEARASFASGYWTGYRPTDEATLGRVTEPSVAELAASGYRDGILDGSWQRTAAKPFQAEQSANYQAAGSAYLGITLAPQEFKNFYREGYLNGYKQAYFSPTKTQVEKSEQ